MATTSKIDEAKELIKAGLKRELILKITSISEHVIALGVKGVRKPFHQIAHHRPALQGPFHGEFPGSSLSILP